MSPRAGDPWGEAWTPVNVERASGELSRYGSPEEADSAPDRVVDDAIRLLGLDRASVWQLGPGGRTLSCRVRHPAVESDSPGPTTIPDGMGPQMVSLLDRLGVLALEDAHRNPRPDGPLGEWLAREGVDAFLAQPIRRNGVMTGFIAFEVTGRTRPWKPADLDRAEALARRVVLAPEPSDGPEPSAGPAPEVAVTPPATGVEDGLGQGPDTAASSAMSRRVGPALTARIRRFRHLEGVGILGLELARDVRALTELQDGFLSLLEAVLDDRPSDLAVVRDAREAGREARRHLEAFLRWTERGTGAHRELDLNELGARMAIRLGKITGDSVPLLFSPSSRPVPILGIESYVERAVEHLVRNAREASESGRRVRVAIRPPEGGDPEGLARIEVHDEGTGIGPELLPWVLEPFVSRTGRGHHRGLGLPMVQAVAEGHGGRVELETRPGRGTSVALCLPATMRAGSGPGHGTGLQIDAGRPDEERPLVLIVEDDPILSRLLDRTLDRGGFRVQRVEHAVAARQVLDQVSEVALLVVERRGPAGEPAGPLIREARRSRDHLPALILDRRLRAESAAEVDALLRDEGVDPRTPLLYPPFDPADVLAEARRLVRTGVHEEGPASRGPVH